MRLRGALLWEADGEPRRDEVLISDERPNGSGSRIVILDQAGQPRAASPGELPEGSTLLLPSDVSDRDVDRIQGSGFVTRRDSDADVLEFEARRAAIEAAEAELDEVAERLRRLLRVRHPNLFDSNGHLLMEEYSRLMFERTGRQPTLTREGILALEGDPPFPPEGSGPADAS